MGRLFGLNQLPHTLAFCFCVVWTATATAAMAQPPESVNTQIASDPPAHVSFVDGAAVLERDGQRDNAPMNMPLLAGDRVRTQNGRVEILFGDGSALHMDSNTTIDFQSDELVRVLAGRIRLDIPGPDRGVSYRIDAPVGSAMINQPGEYRLSLLPDARDGEIELAVIRGGAELVNDDGRTALRAGQRAYARANAAPSYAYAFNSASWDAFDRWSETRRDQRLGVSAQYLPSEVRPYATEFDQYGAWQYDTSYGYVWYPSVAVGWRPYYRGRWVTMRPYGWTWVGLDPWAWPTHHYGRWGFSAGLWFWIPGRTWGPAWVSWAYAPGYVSWCPLGWNNHAVLQFGFSYGYDPWRAWTVVPQRHFGVDYVHARYVGGHAFDAQTRGSFVPRYSAPESGGYAVPRSSSPIRVAGTARPSGPSSTVYTNLEPGASRVGQGGQRVIVGRPRNTLADPPPVASVPADRSRAVTRGAPTNQAAVPGGPRTYDVPSAADRSANRSRQAIPRDDSGYRAPGPSPRTYSPGIDRSQAGSPRLGDTPAYRDNPYIRRAPDRADTAAPGAMAYPSYGSPNRPAPGSARPAAPEYRPYGIERSAPGAGRPSGPPPESARPAAPPGNPGIGRSAPGPDNRGGPPPAQAHPRGGQPSGGTAVRRGGR